jgi:hypothetical protein
LVTRICDGSHKPSTISTVISGAADVASLLMEGLEGIRCDSSVF